MSVMINTRSEIMSKLNTLKLFFYEHYKDMQLSDFDLNVDLKLFDLLHEENFKLLNNNEAEYIKDNFKVKLKLYALNKIHPKEENKRIKKKI